MTAGLAGTTLGHYSIKQRLGRGGMSEVYQAYDERRHRMVALKVVSSSHADYIERFHREAEAIATLNHEHILPAFDYGEQEPWHYLVMPCIEQGTLRDRLERGPLSLEEADEILSQIASALQFAHDKGIIHRDIKPSNILMRDAHHIYLADFGLAKSLEGGNTLTQTGALLGTPEYMAPELSEGPATTSSDLYALGILLYQMVTGQLPFVAETPVAVYWKQLRDRPEPPSFVNPAIPPAIDHVILRALEKDPTRRYQTAQELAAAYHRALTMPELAEVELAATHEMAGNEYRGSYHSLPGGRLVLPADPAAVPSAVPPQRRRLIRRSLASIPLQRRRARKSSPPTPPPMEELEPLTPAPVHEVEQLHPQPVRRRVFRRRTRPEPVRQRQEPKQRRKRTGNPVFIAAGIGLGMLALVSLIIAFVSTNYSSQVDITAATANANATSAAHIQNTQIAQQQNATATAGVAATATHGTLILSDALTSNTNGRWAESGSSCSFVNSSYHAYVKQPGSIQPCVSTNIPASNGAIQADVSLLSGDSAGLLLRVNGQQYYDFEINNAAQFFFRRHDSNGTYTILLDKTRSDAIALGTEKNTLLVIAHGDDFKLYINGVFVDDVHDSTYSGGQIGFIAATLPTTPFGEASFANLRIYQS